MEHWGTPEQIVIYLNVEFTRKNIAFEYHEFSIREVTSRNFPLIGGFFGHSKEKRVEVSNRRFQLANHSIHYLTISEVLENNESKM